MTLKSFLYALVISIIFWVLLPLTFILLSQQLGLPIFDMGIIKFIGGLLIVMGVIVSVVAGLTFVRFGKGTPALNKSPQKLVFKGLYKISRNPIYVAHLIITLGIFFTMGHLLLLIYLLLEIIGWHTYIIKHEEPILKNRYGDDYLKYMEKVPRWI